jgi:putative endonuclease
VLRFEFIRIRYLNEYRLHNPEVGGSIPPFATRKDSAFAGSFLFQSNFEIEMRFTTYVLYSVKHDRLYIGFSSDYEKRFLWHNELATKGFTVKYRPWKIIHLEHFETKEEAMKREKALKGGQGRAWIRATYVSK